MISIADILTPQEMEIAAWLMEGREHQEIAGWLRCSKQAVAKRISIINRALADAGISIPLPKRLHNPGATRHVRPIAINV